MCKKMAGGKKTYAFVKLIIAHKRFYAMVPLSSGKYYQVSSLLNPLEIEREGA